MSAEELFGIVDPWFQTGSLDESLKPVVQQYYTELTGDTGERCRRCLSYWSDVLHTLRVHLASLGFKSMENTQEYMISPKVRFVQIHGLPYVYINKGTGRESSSAKYLTDAIAKQLLKDRPDLQEVIIKNPDYVAPVKSRTRTAKAAQGNESAATAADGGQQTESPITGDVQTNDSDQADTTNQQ